jgi:hypothetical protein
MGNERVKDEVCPIMGLTSQGGGNCSGQKQINRQRNGSGTGRAPYGGLKSKRETVISVGMSLEVRKSIGEERGDFG